MPEVGDTAPDFMIDGLRGDSIELSAFRGNYVFLDFWASWCAPCRAKHRSLVKIRSYLNQQTLKDSAGFTIISISLDTDPVAWKKAIEQDHLDWPGHGCDFKKWDSPVVKKYGLSYLPYNFLIDPGGKVIAKGMSGPEMEKTCLELIEY